MLTPFDCEAVTTLQLRALQLRSVQQWAILRLQNIKHAIAKEFLGHASTSRSLNREGAGCSNEVSSRLSRLKYTLLRVFLRKKRGGMASIDRRSFIGFMRFRVLVKRGEHGQVNGLANCELST
jgi:hypothetical protein